MPIGGIGTGTISLGGRGDLRDWEVMQRPAKGFAPERAFFAVYAKSPGGHSVARVLEGPIDPPYDAERAWRGGTAGLPRFRKCRFLAAYPLGQVLLDDPKMPLDARIEAFNPLIPVAADPSGLPVAIVRFVLTNRTAKRVTAAVCGSFANFIGGDGTNGRPCRNVNEFRKADRVQGVFMRSDGVDPLAEQFGTVALTTTAGRGVTHRTAWDAGPFPKFMPDFWRDFSLDGKLEERAGDGKDAPMASLCVNLPVPPLATRTVTFLVTWHFPNRRTWTSCAENDGCCDAADQNDIIGNYYTTQYGDAWAAAEDVAKRLPRLEKRTVRFVSTFCASDLPDVVKEAALYNVSTLRTQTCFRTPDGLLFGWEGSCDDHGCCSGSCTHVWNYEQAVPFLFGDLAKGMREVEFQHATADNGLMSYRVGLPLERGTQYGLAAADGQMGCLMKLYRDWQLSGDDEMLRRLWPNARKALAFAWIPGGWDADRDGVMEGCQHNTTDLEFYGPNPLMAGWYLGALRAAEEMAKYLGEQEFAEQCRDLFKRGGSWVDENLFNGEYYIQQVRSPAKGELIADGLASYCFMTEADMTDPPQQLYDGCLTDQLVGQFMANICGLGRLLNGKNIRSTLRSIMRHNFIRDMSDYVNCAGAFALNEEKALVFGTYPPGTEPERPCFRFFENWTGIEYAAAALMMQEGRRADGLKVFAAVRERFDGHKRNPFDEPECGHHYVRAMASWAAVPAMAGFKYSAVKGTINFAPLPKSKDSARVFWSNGYAWGTFTQKRTRSGVVVELTAMEGRLKFKRLQLGGKTIADHPSPIILRFGRSIKVTI